MTIEFTRPQQVRERPSAVPESKVGAQEPTATEVKTWVSVVVPTRNEAANVGPLLDRLDPVLAAGPAEVIFVDDSDDATPIVVMERAAQQRPGLSVRLVHRENGHRAGGLGTAVVAGFRAAQGEWVVVMDGDLQHPPELVPELVKAGIDARAGVVVASRHVAGGSSDGLAGFSRVLVSDSATWISKILFPIGLRGVSDPMSGFFAVRREAVDPARLRPDGFKILMELLVRNPSLKRAEVGFVFEDRVAGESKASFVEGLHFAHHLVRLSLRRLLPGERRRIRAARGL